MPLSKPFSVFIILATGLFVLPKAGAQAQSAPCASIANGSAAVAAWDSTVLGPRSPAWSGSSSSSETVSAPAIPCSSAFLFDFSDADLKFRMESLMNLLRDARHESWVLAAYPDPKTSRPLIGAGFSLDLEARDHPQQNSMNPHTFLEPSSAQLWSAAGLDTTKLQNILQQFNENLAAWNKRNYRRKIRMHQLTPQVTDQDAMKLLRISVEQAAYNAQAYCREFNQLSASQQMALTQLVYQMGVNLEEFTTFLATINDLSYHEAANGSSEAAAEHWKAVQTSLIQSDWARRYSTRAVSVIAMFNPTYQENPSEAERQVRIVLHPRSSRHKKSQVRLVRTANRANHAHRPAHPGNPSQTSGTKA